MSKNRIYVPATLLACLLLAGCGSMRVWPFGDDPAAGSQPGGATEYRCEGGKRFQVRLADNGNSAWLMYPDREIALAREGGGTRYSNGVAVLELGGGEATLNDGPAISYQGCKAATPSK